MKDTTIDIGGSKCNGQEKSGIRWTTYNNTKSWFDNLGHDLVKLGFAIKSDDGLVKIPYNKLNQIQHVETCLTLDGGSGKWDECLAVVCLGKINLMLEKLSPSPVLL